MKRTLLIAFFLVLIAEVVGIYLASDVKWVTRPLISVIMIIYYAVESSVKSPMLLLALVTSLLGDMFFLLPEGAGFTLGIFVFAIFNVILVAFFNQTRQTNSESSRYLIAGAIALIAAAIGYYILNNAETLQKLILALLISGTAMIVMSILRSHKLPGYRMVILGTILVFASHLLLSVLHLVTPINYGPVIAAAMFGVGLFLIVEGSIKGDAMLVHL